VSSSTLDLTGYVNPFRNANVTAERIDQGVDYAGTGALDALGAGKIIQVLSPAQSGWPGYYIEEQLTSGSLAGADIYYAEGFQPTVAAGATVAAGQKIADFIPGWHSGTETGLADGINTTYASTHGGYSEGQLTRAGQWFSNLLAALGAKPGLVEGRSPVGQSPTGQLPGPNVAAGGVSGNVGSSGGIAGAVSTATGAVTGAVSTAAGAAAGVVSGATDWVGQLWGDVTGAAKYAGLWVALVLVGVFLMIRGLGGQHA